MSMYASRRIGAFVVFHFLITPPFATCGNKEAKEVLLGKNLGAMGGIAVSLDGSKFAANITESGVHVWDAINLKKICVLPYTDGDLSTLAFSKNSKCLARGEWGGMIWRANLETGKKSASASGMLDWVVNVSEGPSNDSFAIVASKTPPSWFRHEPYFQEIRLWNTSTKSVKVVCKGRFESLFTSHDGKALLTVNVDKDVVTGFATYRHNCELMLLDVETGKVIWRRESQPIYDIAQSRDRKTLVTFSGNKTKQFHIWNMLSGKSRRLEGMTGASCFALNSDGSVLVIQESDGSTIQLWNLNTHEAISVGKQELAWNMAFCANDNHLMVATFSGTIRCWRLPANLWKK